MQIINFLYKTKKLTSKLGCVLYQVKIFDPIINQVKIKTLYDDDFLKGYSVNENILFELRKDKDFYYTHYEVRFSSCDDIKIKF